METNYESMTLKELKDVAKEDGIDISGLRKKEDILQCILQAKGLDTDNNKNDIKLEEEQKMEENNNAIANEMETKTEVDTTVEETSTEDTRVWKDAEGNEISMSAFIREQFITNNMSRKDISEKFDINYRTVYGATVNMTNDAAPSTRGRSSQTITIDVTADGHVVSQEGEGEEVKYFIDGEEILPNEADEIVVPETTTVNRNEWIKEQVAAGKERGDLAKALGVSYGVVYGLTKEDGAGRAQHMIEVDGKLIPRAEHIRNLVASGMSKSDVAKTLEVEYSVVWQACKTEKTDAEKFETAVEALTKFTDKVEDKEAFEIILAELKAVTIKKEEEEEQEDSSTEESAEGTTEGTTEA